MRQFRERTFDFHPGFNLLVGENGTGKTTMLRGILATLGGTKQLGRSPRLDDDDIKQRETHAELRAEVSNDSGLIGEFRITKGLWEKAERTKARDLNPLLLVYASNEATCSSLKGKRSKRIKNQSDERMRRDEAYLHRMEFDREMYLRSRFPERSGERGRFGYSESIRRFVSRILVNFSKTFRDFYWRFEPYDVSIVSPAGGELSRNIDSAELEKARDFAMRYFQENWPPREFRPIVWPDRETVLLTKEPQKYGDEYRYLPNLPDIWREAPIHPETRDKLLSYSLEVKLTPRIMIRHEFGALKLSQLSDGEQRLFSLFVDIARQLSLRSPFEEIGSGSAIVLIDEIDVHLHPKWQRLIVPAMEDLFPRCQFIASTHSPFVIQAVDRRRILLVGSSQHLSADSQNNSIEDIIEDIQGVALPQRSQRAERLSNAAEIYFGLLSNSDPQPEALKSAENEYREACTPYTMEPAALALLKLAKLEAQK